MERIVHWLSPAILLLSYSLPAAAQAPPADAIKRMETAAAKQRAAVAAMTSSANRQSEAIRRQLKTSLPTGGFFTLAPPERLLAPVAAPPECDALPPAEIDSLVTTASRREGVEPALIRSVMKEESAFRPCAVSPKGAEGLMQLMPQTAAALEVTDSFDPADNAGAGARLLRQLLQHYNGDLALTLGAYNAGPRRVDAEMTIPGIPETTNYVQRILSLLPMAQMRNLSFDSGPDH